MPNKDNPTFAQLFKKYRLRSEIETLSQFGDLLAQEGLVYENSLFTHWQKGDRVPKDRKVVLKVIRVFVVNKGIRNMEEINMLLASAGQRDIQPKEILELPVDLQSMSLKSIVETKAQSARQLLSKTPTTTFSQAIQSSLPSTLMSGFYFALVIWWIFLNIYHLKSSPLNLAFGFAFGLVPLCGGITGVVSSQRLLIKRSHIRKAVLFFSLGLITWGLGQMVWSVYNFFLNIEVPYPSLSDVGFIISWPLWGIGLYYLARATRSQYTSQVKVSKPPLIILSLLSITVVYYLLIIVARNGAIITHSDILTIFFDLAYPLLDIALIIEAILLYGSSFRYVKKTYRWPVYLVLVSVVLNFFGDFGFSYTTRLNEYYNGNWVDFVFTTTFYLVSIAMNSLATMENYAVMTNNRSDSSKIKKYHLSSMGTWVI